VANTPLRSFRINDELHNAAKAMAEDEGLSLTAVIVALLEDYVGKR
jgi:predicted HicB family RNase H-like nuclease